MKGKLRGRDMKLEIKFRLYLRRTLRQAANTARSKHGPESKLGSTKLFLINSTSGVGVDGSLTVLSVLAPSSTLSTNTTAQSVPSNYLQSHGVTAVSRNSSLVAVLVIMSLFLIVTISTTGLMLVFCRKKNTVFALQKCEQDSEYELDDMEQTDTETCDEDPSPRRRSQVRSRTCPSFTNVTDSDLSSESQSREPLVRRGSTKDIGVRSVLPRSLTINVLQIISKDRTCVENIDDYEPTADVGSSMLMSATGPAADASVLVDMCVSPCVHAVETETRDAGARHANCLALQPTDYSTLLD